MYKKIPAIICASLLTTIALAGHPNDSLVVPTGVNVFAPSTNDFWTIGIELLYMQPSNVDFQYASERSTGTAPRVYENKSVSPGYNFGGEFDATYHFAGNSRDIEVALTHIDVNNSSDVSVQSGRIVEPFGVTSAPNYANYAEGQIDNNTDAVDVVLGQTFYVGHAVILRPFAGIRYADLESNDYARYKDDSTNQARLLGSGRINASFDGVGPRAGVDATYRAGSNVSFVASAAVSLLVGDIDTKITTTNNLTTLPTNTVYKLDEGTSLVPEIDARLGINYHHAIDSDNAFDIQVGYQAFNYFDVIDRDFIDASTPNAINNTSDLAYQGAYLRFQLELA